MRIGISVAQCGRLAQPAAVVAAVRAAEQLGYSSVWVCDSVLDPAGVLGAAAAVTTRVRLGALVRLEGGRDLVALARSLATVDILSEGRLSVAVEGEDDLVGALVDAVDGVPVLLGDRSPPGRDPDGLQLIVRAGVVLDDRPADGDRADYTGDVDQVAHDVDATRRAGA